MDLKIQNIFYAHHIFMDFPYMGIHREICFLVSLGFGVSQRASDHLPLPLPLHPVRVCLSNYHPLTLQLVDGVDYRGLVNDSP